MLFQIYIISLVSDPTKWQMFFTWFSVYWEVYLKYTSIVKILQVYSYNLKVIYKITNKV